MLAWTRQGLRSAASTRLDRVVCSTDSEEIAAAARSFGVEAPFIRPAELARDDTPMLDVVRHAIAELNNPDVLVVLQPTSPLSRATHIDAAVEQLETTGADSVVSVVEIPHAYTPGSVLRLDRTGCSRIRSHRTPTRRQDKPTLYARNGPAVLAYALEVVAARLAVRGRLPAYPMAKLESLDIDDADDLALADLLLRSR